MRIAGIFFIVVLWLASITVGAADTPWPSPTPGFAPKLDYNVDSQEAWSAVLRTLEQNSIGVKIANQQTGQIDSKYVAGPSIPGTNRQPVKQRYAYKILVLPAGDRQVNINVDAILQATEDQALDKVLGQVFGKVIYGDVTNTPEVATRVRDWLYEKIEQTMAMDTAYANTLDPSTLLGSQINSDSHTGTTAAVIRRTGVTGVVEGPDIVGLKLGMKVEDARAVINARKLKNYQELIGVSAYQSSTDSQVVKIAGTLTVNHIIANSHSLAGSDPTSVDPVNPVERLAVSFSPVPHDDRVVIITRTTTYPARHEISQAELRSALVKKYGTPYSEVVSTETLLLFVFPPVNKNKVKPNCMGVDSPVIGLDPSPTAQSAAENAVLGFYRTDSSPSIHLTQLVSQCGDVVLQVLMKPVDSALSASSRMVQEYKASLFSPQMLQDSHDQFAKSVRDAMPAEDRSKQQKGPEL
jgi:hypothetical protein